MRSISLPGFVLAALAAILWGTAGTAQTFIVSDSLSPLWVGAMRILCACLFFYPTLWLSSRSANSNAAPVNKTHYLPKVIAAGFSMAFFNLLFFTGVKTAGVALGSCTIIASAPVWAGILDALIKKKTPDRLWLAGIAVAILGGVWMAVSQADNIAVNAFGMGICLTAGFFYSCYSMLAKELVRMTTPLRASAHSFTVAAFIAFAAAFVLSDVPQLYATDIAIVVYLGVVVTGIAYLLYGTALKTTRVSTCVALGLLEPVTAFFLAIAVVHENVNPWAAVGLVMILLGLALVLKSEQMQNNQTAVSSASGLKAKDAVV